MPRLVQWVQKALRSRTAQNDLKPISSRKNPTETSAETTTGGGPFFDNLPVEIRRTILIMAFGNRTVHLHLESSEQARESHHRNARSPLSGRSRPPVDSAGPRRWRLGVCHRESDAAPLYDYCLDYGGPWWDGLGATGWLLSCRQAFAEGIEVLLSTNTLHICNDPLPRASMNALSRPFPAGHLAMIRSVEIVQSHLTLWPARVGVEMGDSEPSEDPEVRVLRSFMAQIAATLPNVKHVYLSLGATTHRRLPGGERLTPGEKYRHHRDTMMPLVASLVAKHGQGWDEFELGVPVSFYHAYRTMYWDPRVRRCQTPHWRTGSLADRAARREKYPLGGYHVRERMLTETSSETGFWISQGCDDMMGQPWMVMDPWWHDS